ncbi:substrate-binding domain-containing protein [Acidothermaceae bacterium B102]|nr:substrate-binding domain-containing protein [Acidothermaceae bacterium B102]
MSNRAMKFAALGAVAAVALTGCGSSSGSKAAASSAAPATSAAAVATSAAAVATSAAAVATSAAASAVASTAPATSAAASASSAGTATGKVGVILPDTVTSKRWENNDRPSLDKAFKAAGLTDDIQNADGDASKWLQICQAMIGEKVTVLLEVDIDVASATKCITDAHAQGIKVIDYDRLSLGGGADYYVSFDNVQVGKLQGEGLVACLKAKGVTKPAVAEINGDSKDNNATLFAQGYNSVLDPLYASGAYTKAGNQTGQWKPDIAKTVWQSFYTQYKGKIDGAIIANDGMGDGVITAMQSEGVAGKIPFTGQDAQDSGLARILLGQQCMTVFKDTAVEASLASKLAIALIKKTDTTALVNSKVTDTVLKKDVPFAAATPESITATNVMDVIKTGYTTAANVCKLAGAAACAKAGVK